VGNNRAIENGASTAIKPRARRAVYLPSSSTNSRKEMPPKPTDTKKPVPETKPGEDKKKEAPKK
jgi:hypothetical protein